MSIAPKGVQRDFAGSVDFLRVQNRGLGRRRAEGHSADGDSPPETDVYIMFRQAGPRMEVPGVVIVFAPNLKLDGVGARIGIAVNDWPGAPGFRRVREVDIPECARPGGLFDQGFEDRTRPTACFLPVGLPVSTDILRDCQGGESQNGRLSGRRRRPGYVKVDTQIRAMVDSRDQPN